MGAFSAMGDDFDQRAFRVGRQPLNRPVSPAVIAAVVGPLVEKRGAVGVVAFNIGEIEERFGVGQAKGADLFVSPMEVPFGPRAVEVTRHIDEPDARKIPLEHVHQVKVIPNVRFRRSGHLAAPRPHHNVAVAAAVAIERVAWAHVEKSGFPRSSAPGIP
jgi:hypothetical protein